MRSSTASSATCATRATRRSCATRPRSMARRPRHWRSREARGRAALSQLDSALQDALYLAAEQIAAFHRKQLRTSWLDYSDEGAGSGRASARSRRRLHPGRDGGLSIVAADDRRAGARRRRAGDHRLYAAWTEWRDLTPGAGGRRSGWRRSRLWHRWSAGDRGDGLWHRDRSPCRQDLRTGQHLRRAGQAPCLRHRRYRPASRSDRDAAGRR